MEASGSHHIALRLERLEDGGSRNRGLGRVERGSQAGSGEGDSGLPQGEGRGPDDRSHLCELSEDRIRRNSGTFNTDET